MISNKKSTIKKWQVLFAGGAVFMYFVYMLTTLIVEAKETSVFSVFWNMSFLNTGIMFLPYFVLLLAALISSKLNGNSRYIPYLLVGMELILSLLGRWNLVNYHPIGVLEGIGLVSYDWISSILFTLLNIVFLAIPFAKKTTLICYSGIVSTIYIISMVLEICHNDFQIGVITKFMASILYQSSFIWFAYEMTLENRIHIYSKIIDFFIGLDYFEEYDYSDTVDDINEKIVVQNQKYNIYDLNENDKINNENAIEESWINRFNDATLKKKNSIEIKDEDFLIDPSDEGSVVYKLEHLNENNLTVSGRFIQTFSEEQAAKILRKKSVLNKTFQDIKMDAIADTDIGIEFLEKGNFTIQLKKKSFDVANDNYSAARAYMIQFLKTIIVIQNTESYE